MESDLLILHTTLPEEFNVNLIIDPLLKQKLAVCIQVSNTISSYYVWKNKIENDKEIQITVKFLSINQEKVESFINKSHPYETPEIIIIDPYKVGNDYLDWANSNQS